MKRKEWLAIIFIVVVAVVLMYLTGIGCPILKITGIPCFGCGMTRACISLLQLDFAAAWQYHPLIFLMPLCTLAFLSEQRLPKGLVKGIRISVVALFVIVYMMRLFDPGNEVIKWHPENGEFYKIIRRLLQK